MSILEHQLEQMKSEAARRTRRLAVRLACVRIGLCLAVIALGAPAAVDFLLILAAVGILGASAMLAAALWIILMMNAGPLDTVLWSLTALPVALVLTAFSPAWDALSLSALWRLFREGPAPAAGSSGRENSDRYHDAYLRLRLCGAVFALALVIGMFRSSPVMPYSGSLIWHGLWILPLVFGAEKAGEAVCGWFRDLYSPGPRFVIYDGDCSFCARTGLVLAHLDVFELLTFVDFRSAEQFDSIPVSYLRDLTTEDCKREVVYSTSEGNAGGFYAFRDMAWTMPTLWPAAGVMILPGVAALGVPAYRWVADNRMRIRIRNAY